jgi:hypothetical protein
MTNTNALTLTIDANTSLEVRVMHLGLDHYRAFVRGGGFHLSRASATSENAAIEIALEAAGWTHYHWRAPRVASPANAERVLAAIEARRTGPILEGSRRGFYGVTITPVAC